MIVELHVEKHQLLLLLMLLLLSATTSWGPPPLPSWPHRATRQRAPRLGATSSSKLKDTRSSVPKKGSVVTRLSQAAAQAKQAVDKRKRQQAETDATTASRKSLGALQNLTAGIQTRLENNQQSTLNNPNRDAMIELLRHNQEAIPPPAAANSVKQVAIVLTKPLQNDRLTVEHANRVRRLVRTVMVDDYRPNVICFVGPQSPGNLVADADASYLFFQEVCASQNITTHGIDIHLVKGSVAEGALEQIAYFLKGSCSPVWTRELQAGQRLHVHFTLVSSEYELCQLNDIHARSPGLSSLRTLTTWSSRSYETTWTYLYTSTVLAAAEFDATRIFRVKTFQAAQELIPVLQHLQGVTDNREFFQVEAYRVLVAARRSMVKEMEGRSRKAERSADLAKEDEIVLEAALLSLGRCLDLIRPAGRGTGVVTVPEWKMAAILLQRAVRQMVRIGDTDRPLPPHEWGRLEEDKTIMNAGGDDYDRDRAAADITVEVFEAIDIRAPLEGEINEDTDVQMHLEESPDYPSDNEAETGVLHEDKIERRALLMKVSTKTFWNSKKAAELKQIYRQVFPSIEPAEKPTKKAIVDQIGLHLQWIKEIAKSEHPETNLTDTNLYEMDEFARREVFIDLDEASEVEE
jgi:hypothetical protein